MSEFTLPEGKTCIDCVYFERTCMWLLSREGEDTECDWLPIKFLELEKPPESEETEGLGD